MSNYFIKSIRTVKPSQFINSLSKHKYNTCEKIFDCNKFWYGIILGMSFGYYFGYEYYSKVNSKADH
jgi:hypothetical protein